MSSSGEQKEGENMSMENNIAKAKLCIKHDKNEIHVCIAYFPFMHFTIYHKPDKKTFS